MPDLFLLSRLFICLFLLYLLVPGGRRPPRRPPALVPVPDFPPSGAHAFSFHVYYLPQTASIAQFYKFITHSLKSPLLLKALEHIPSWAAGLGARNLPGVRYTALTWTASSKSSAYMISVNPCFWRRSRFYPLSVR